MAERNNNKTNTDDKNLVLNPTRENASNPPVEHGSGSANVQEKQDCMPTESEVIGTKSPRSTNSDPESKDKGLEFDDTSNTTTQNGGSCRADVSTEGSLEGIPVHIKQPVKEKGASPNDGPGQDEGDNAIPGKDKGDNDDGPRKDRGDNEGHSKDKEDIVCPGQDKRDNASLDNDKGDNEGHNKYEGDNDGHNKYEGDNDGPDEDKEVLPQDGVYMGTNFVACSRHESPCFEGIDGDKDCGGATKAYKMDSEVSRTSQYKTEGVVTETLGRDIGCQVSITSEQPSREVGVSQNQEEALLWKLKEAETRQIAAKTELNNIREYIETFENRVCVLEDRYDLEISCKEELLSQVETCKLEMGKKEEDLLKLQGQYAVKHRDHVQALELSQLNLDAAAQDKQRLETVIEMHHLQLLELQTANEQTNTENKEWQKRSNWIVQKEKEIKEEQDRLINMSETQRQDQNKLRIEIQEVVEKEKRLSEDRNSITIERKQLQKATEAITTREQDLKREVERNEKELQNVSMALKISTEESKRLQAKVLEIEGSLRTSKASQNSIIDQLKRTVALKDDEILQLKNNLSTTQSSEDEARELYLRFYSEQEKNLETVSELKKELEETRSKIGKLNSEQEESSLKIDELEKRLQEKESTIQDQKCVLDQLNAGEFATTKRHLADTEERLAACALELKTVQEEHNSYVEKMKYQQNQLQEAICLEGKKLKSAEDAVSVLQQKFQNQRGKLLKSLAEKETLLAEKERIEQSNAALQNQLEVNIQTHSQHKEKDAQEIQALTSKLKAATNSAQELESKVANLEASLNSVIKEISEQHTLITDLGLKLTLKDSEIEQLQGDLRNSHSLQGEANDENSRLHARQEDNYRRIESLERKLEEKESDIEVLKSERDKYPPREFDNLKKLLIEKEKVSASSQKELDALQELYKIATKKATEDKDKLLECIRMQGEKLKSEEGELKTWKQNFHKQKGELQKCSAEKDALLSENRQAELSKANLQSQLQVVSKQSLQQQNLIQQQLCQLLQMETSLASSAGQTDILQQTIGTKDEQIRELVVQKSTLELRLYSSVHLEEQCSSLREMHQTAQQTISQLKGELDKATSQYMAALRYDSSSWASRENLSLKRQNGINEARIQNLLKENERLIGLINGSHR